MDSGLLAEKIEDVLYSAIPFLDESNPDKVIDMAITFGLQLLATLVLFLIIRFKFWNVITGMMEKRKASVEEAISAKDEALIELENAKKDAEELKGNSKKEAQMIIDEAKKSSVVEANAIIEEANQKIQDESARAREQIEKEHQEMQDRIKDAGMNCVRCNFSHGDHAEQKARMDLIREINKENNQDIIDEAIKKMDDNK